MLNRSSPVVPVNIILAISRRGMWFVPCLFALLARAPAQGEKAPPDPDPAQEYGVLLEELRRAYPDRDSMELNFQKAADMLKAFIQKHPTTPEAAQARALAGEVLLLGGDNAAARRHWEALARFGPGDEDRARGLYLLGDHYFLRDSQNAARQEKYLNAAHAYFRALEERFPETRWAQAARKPLRYLGILRQKALPSFEASFHVENKQIQVTSASLRGKLLILVFWRSNTQGQGGFEATLARDLASTLDKYPELQGRVEVLGVNLDRDRAAFETAVARWGILWPQNHDGKGFQSSLAELVGIPRVPHLAVVSPEGELLYLGADTKVFFARATQALRECRKAVPAAPPAAEDRARCLFFLSRYYYVRSLHSSPEREKHLVRAHRHLHALLESHPESSWRWGTGGPLRYLDMRVEKRLPPFEATFRKGDEELRLSNESLRGKLVILDFWRSDTPRQREFEELLASDLGPLLFPDGGLAGRAEVLGVNLDTERGKFEAAVKEWGIPWPQYHDGKGADSPLATRFGISRSPHIAVVDPQGKLLYVGSDRQRFFAVKTEAVRRLTAAQKQ